MKGQFAFLISQPRAGSTMLQQILAGHPLVGTVGEPWLLLPLLCPYDEVVSSAPFGAHIADEANKHFFERFSKGSDVDLKRRCVRAYAEEAYAAANACLGTRIFLDKTPRYYLIGHEILKTFPDSRIIVLVRDPCAVFASILSSWVGNILLKLRYFKTDFLVGPSAICELIEQADPRVLAVKYEDLLVNPDSEISRILSHLGLPDHHSLQFYGGRELEQFALGDHKSVYRLESPDPSRVTSWKVGLKDPQVWRLARDYVSWLEKQNEVMSRLGYDIAEFKAELKRQKPSGWKICGTIPLAWLEGEYGRFLQPICDFFTRLRCRCVRRGKRI
jgi:hypothetical protein